MHVAVACGHIVLLMRRQGGYDQVTAWPEHARCLSQRPRWLGRVGQQVEQQHLVEARVSEAQLMHVAQDELHVGQALQPFSAGLQHLGTDVQADHVAAARSQQGGDGPVA